ncbi:MAG: hypothetical protein QW594_00945 [Candidatus Woesearchaeota archaeon]
MEVKEALQRKAVHPFYLRDGTCLHTLQDLIELLELMDEHFYQYYANDQKNDFSTWISHEFGYHDLAKAIRYKSPLKAKETILAYLYAKSAHDKNQKNKHYSQQTQVYNQEKNILNQEEVSSPDDEVSQELKQIEKRLDAYQQVLQQGSNTTSNTRKLQASAILQGAQQQQNNGDLFTKTLGMDKAERLKRSEQNKEEEVVNVQQQENTQQAKSAGVQKEQTQPLQKEVTSFIIEDALSKKQELVRLKTPAQVYASQEPLKGILPNEKRKPLNEEKQEIEPDVHEPETVPVTMRDVPLATITFLNQTITQITRTMQEQQAMLNSKSQEIAVLKHTLEKKERELENYKKNLHTLSQENKALTFDYLNLKEKEHRLEQAELKLREQIQAWNERMDRLKPLLETKNIQEQELEREESWLNEIKKNEQSLTHKLLRNELKLKQLPQQTARLEQLSQEQEDQGRTTKSIEEEVDQLLTTIDNALSKMDTELEKKKRQKKKK